MAKNQPRNQHYVPQFYLREFATDETYGKGKKSQVYICNKKIQSCEIDPRNISSIASQSYLYTPKNINGNRDYYMDKRLEKFENLYAPIWRNLIKEEKNIDRKKMSYFLASLILRHPNNLKKNEYTREALYDDILKHNPPNNKKVAFIINEKEYPFNIDEFNNITEYEKSMFFIENIDSFILEFMEIIMKKNWRIVIEKDKKFITSDNPVCIVNASTDIFGLTTKGTIIIFPISPKMLLILDDDIGKSDVIEQCSLKHHSCYNLITWKNSDNHIIFHRNMDEVMEEIASFLRNNNITK
jgi:hypothetical protein